jgi:hypothetical protein
VDDAEECADGHLLAELQPWVELLPSPSVHPDLPALAALAAAHENRAAISVQVALG